MPDNSVLQEVRTARDAYARSHGYDVRAMVADLRERDAHDNWPVVRLAPRLLASPSEDNTLRSISGSAGGPDNFRVVPAAQP